MTLATEYNERMKRPFELELSADGLDRFASLAPTRRKPEDVAAALRWAAQVIDAQSRLLAQMRVGLQPFAMATPSWRGPDDTVIVDGRGFQLKLGHFRVANKLWHSRLS